MNLIEGNYIEGRFRSDAGFGTQNYFTLFRNRIEQQQGKSDQVCTFDLERGQHYCNAVGNVLGTEGYETVYEHENSDISLSTRVIYRLGYEDPYDDDASGNDPLVKSTLLRHGNWDAVTKDIVWDPGITDRNLPASYYRNSKPEFFGNLRWPAIGPDVPGYTGTIPAKVRYEGGTVNTDSDHIIYPEGFVLMQNYPNPFSVNSGSSSAGNTSTKIKYALPGRGAANRIASGPDISKLLRDAGSASWHVQLKVYDLLGREVSTLVDQQQSAGNYEVEFSALGRETGELPSGIYFYQLSAGEVKITKKMLLMK